MNAMSLRRARCSMLARPSSRASRTDAAVDRDRHFHSAFFPLVLSVSVLAAIVVAQAPQPKVKVLSPADGSLISGPVALRAEVDPPESASSVVFFVDGRQVCTVTAAPFECRWDAGAVIL